MAATGAAVDRAAGPDVAPPGAASDDAHAVFLAAVAESLAAGTFLKLALAKYRGVGAESRCAITRVALKGEPHLRFVTRQGTQEVSANTRLDDGLRLLARLIGGDYRSATLFAATGDLSIVYSKKRVARLTRAKPSLSAAPPVAHDRAKDYLVDAGRAYLKQLGVTHGGDDGKPRQVKPSMYAKYRQICRFVEILDQLMAASPIKDTAAPRIVDIGAGKGYLTFALHDHLVRQRGKAPATVGIEANAALVDACRRIADDCAMTGLTFEARTAESFAAGSLDILIALHACDTATDDAIHLGITAGAALIVTAPCCQHELAPQLPLQAPASEKSQAASAAATPLAGLMKFGLFKQRQADLVTDAMRCLLLEAHGYEVRVIEFVATEHTAKNLMLAAVRSPRVDRAGARRQLEALVAAFGITEQRLMRRLGMSRSAS